MPASNQDFITLCYNDYPEQKEFVFSMKGRPFSMLSSQKLPVPTSSLIDFNLVSDLGLRMTDLQCSKFSYGGQKFRILGKISQTVQTITDGVVSGTVHLEVISMTPSGLDGVLQLSHFRYRWSTPAKPF